LRVVKSSWEDVDHCVRILSIPAVLWSHQFGRRIRLGAHGGTKLSTGQEDIGDDSADLPTLSSGLEIEHSDFKVENATLKGDYLFAGS